MENTHTHPSTKEGALKHLYVASKKARAAVSRHVDFVQVAPGRQLITCGMPNQSIIVGVSGSALLSTPDGHVVQIKAPFVIDEWASDERSLAKFTILAEADSTLLIADRRCRTVVFDQIQWLSVVSPHTCNVVQAATQTIDLSDPVATKQNLNPADARISHG